MISNIKISKASLLIKVLIKKTSLKLEGDLLMMLMVLTFDLGTVVDKPKMGTQYLGRLCNLNQIF